MNAATTLKSHCEAERRRRERIDSHLTELRGLVPTTAKLNKAALLAQVIIKVKELENSATEASMQCTLPSNSDEVRVEACGNVMNEGCFLIKASICCKDRPEILGYLKQTIRSLGLKIIKAEISFVEGRVKSVLVMACEGSCSNARDLLRRSVREALESVLKRIITQAEFFPRGSVSGKRQRMSSFESLYSS